MQAPAGPQTAADSAAASAAASAPGGPPPAAAASEDIRSLWIGDLQYWMDENYLWSCFSHTGQAVTVKVIRNKASGYSEGYGFIEFSSHAAAQSALQSYHGTPMPQTENQPFRLNWASFGMGDRRGMHDSPEFSIFVGDLAPEVNDFVLTDTFRSVYPSVKGGKVVLDNFTGRTKGYGFVRFSSEEERDRSLTEMNGKFCASRPMRISIAVPKKQMLQQQQQQQQQQQGQQQGGQQGGYGVPPKNLFQHLGEDDPNNTTIFVGGLDFAITDEQLRQVFSQYGELTYVKIPFGKGCGFVQFAQRSQAEEALSKLHGSVIGTQAVRLSWGRHPASKRYPNVGGGVGGGGAPYGAGPPPAAGGYYQQPPPAAHDPMGGAWGQQQAAGGYYGQQAPYGLQQPYDQSQQHHMYGQDPNAYAAYGAAAGYGYGYPPPQQGAAGGQLPGVDPSLPGATAAPVSPGPPFDPMAPADVNRMNAEYMQAHETGLMNPHLLISKPAHDSLVA